MANASNETRDADLQNPIGAPVEPVRFDAGDLDPSTHPLDDLDAFVNARWRAANPVPADRSCWDSFAILHERSLQIQAGIAADAAVTEMRSDAERVVGDLWASGMRTDADSTLLRAELARIAALDDAAAIAAYIGDRHARGWPLLFGFEVEPAFDDPRATIACIHQGGLGLPDRKDYLDATDAAQRLRDAYALHVAAMLAWDGSHSSEIRTLAADVVAFETRLAAASVPRQTLARDIAQRQQRIDIETADRLSPAFSWSAFFAAQGIVPPASFSLGMPSFHAEAHALLSEATPQTWRAYLRFHTIDSVAPYFNEELAELQHRFHGEVLRGQRALKPRWKRALDAINAQAGEAIGELYVAREFSGSARNVAEQLIERLRDALHGRIKRQDWMSTETKSRALHKLAAMRAKVGYPKRWRDWSAVPTSQHDWLANLLAAREHNQRWKLAQLAQPVDTEAWRMTPQTINAGYDPQRNEIVFPAAILQPPFFNADADDALNYGGIGAVIAHEMTHGYDDQGSRFDADGRLQNWWSDEDRAGFDARAQKLVDLFDSTHSANGKSVNGRLTLGENIADFGGLAIAFDALDAALAESPGDDAWLDGYSQRQRFFLSWATIWRQNLNAAEALTRLRIDTHAPARLRANMAPANMAGFAEVFSSSNVGAPPRLPLKRVAIW